jgi:hypothetical protein
VEIVRAEELMCIRLRERFGFQHADGVLVVGALTTDVGTAFSLRLFWIQVAKVE